MKTRQCGQMGNPRKPGKYKEKGMCDFFGDIVKLYYSGVLGKKCLSLD